MFGEGLVSPKRMQKTDCVALGGFFHQIKVSQQIERKEPPAKE